MRRRSFDIRTESDGDLVRVTVLDPRGRGWESRWYWTTERTRDQLMALARHQKARLERGGCWNRRQVRH